MQMSPSLSDFVSRVDSGPKGVEEAMSAIASAAAAQTASLDLQQMALTDDDLQALLPSLLALAPHLTVLNLFLNEITVLPASLSGLRNLKELHVGANPLADIQPGTLLGLTFLQELDIGFSDTLCAIPDDIGSCSNLRVLHAGNGLLKHVPSALCNCLLLEELHLYGNDLRTLPAEIGRLKNLRILNIGRNCINALPAGLAQCTCLEALYVYENTLKTFPPGLDQISTLRVINADCNAALPAVPRNIGFAADAKLVAKFYAAV